MTYHNNKSVRVVSLLLLIAMPALLACLLPRLLFGAKIVEYMPVWSDEIEYWVEAKTVLGQGLFKPAYFGVGKISSAAELMPFMGTHGPAYPALAAAFACVFGWKTYTGVLLNITALTVALLTYVRLIRPGLRGTLMVLAITALSWPLVLYLNVTMQESINQAVGILLAAIFYRLLSDKQPAPFLALTGVVILISIFSLLRPTWCLLLFPLFLSQRAFSLRSITISIVLALGLATTLTTAYFSLVSPYPYSFPNNLIADAQATPGGPWAAIVTIYHGFTAHAIYNGLALLLPGPTTSLMEILIRYQILALCALLLFYSIQSARSGFRDIRLWSTAFPAICLVSIVLLQVLLYDINDWRDFRIFSPFLIMSLMFLVACGRYRIVMTVILSSIVFSPAFIHQYKIFNEGRYATDPTRYELFEKEITSRLSSHKSKEPWCNNILVGTENLNNYLMSLPPGFVFNFTMNWYDIPYRPRYVLINPEIILLVHDYVKLKALASTSFGTLYLNLDSPCPE